jgi:chromosome segregation ATPase
LNIASADKDKLSEEVSNLNKEQRAFQDKVDELERDLENEKTKKRQVEREIHEINIKMS